MEATVLGGPLKVQILGGTLADRTTGNAIEIGTQKQLIGRAKQCDLRVDDANVSAIHLEAVATERGVHVRDLSRNGAWIGKTRISEVSLVGPETIRIGGRDLYFEPAAASSEHALPASFGSLRSASPRMRAVFELLQQVARTSKNVHLTGESGTGKTHIARVIHERSPRARKPFVVINIAEIPDALLESALFGHVKGAFTGATETKVSPFVEADGGTVFIDEIGDLPEHLQKALLRLLDEKVVQPVGSNRTHRVDVRIITATLHDLQARVLQKRGFRQDLLFRLGMTIEIPPLRERLEDFGTIVEAILRDMGRADSVTRIPVKTLDRLRERSWPGNIRDVREVVSFAAESSELTGEVDLEAAYTAWFRHRSAGDSTTPARPAASAQQPSRDGVNQLIDAGATLEAVEEYARKIMFTRLLSECGGVVADVARRANVSIPYARRQLQRFSIREPGPRPRQLVRKYGKQ